MLKKIFYVISALLLITLGFVWGCASRDGSNGLFNANAKEETTYKKTIFAETVYASSFVLMDENDDMKGHIYVSDGGAAIAFGDVDGTINFSLRANNEGSSISFRSKDNRSSIFMGVDYDAAYILLDSGHDETSVFINLNHDIGPAIVIYNEKGDVIWSSYR